MDIIELGQSGVFKVGTWNSTMGFNFSRLVVASTDVIDNSSLKNRTFVVLTALVRGYSTADSDRRLSQISFFFPPLQSAPYGMLKESAEKLSGNDRFEGFGVDLIHELSLMLGFNYSFRIQEDGVYGSLVNGEWNGMVKELLEYVRISILVQGPSLTSLYHSVQILRSQI